MALILNIDTAIDKVSVCLAKDGNVIVLAEDENNKDHGKWLHNAINIMMTNHFTLNELHAVSVSIGPGSYTGLRIGLSTAKGLCYVLKIPLITIGTLEMMAFAARMEEADLLCPMIDARRNEVFTALFTKDQIMLMEPCAMILSQNSFDEYLSENKILFFGNGSKKTQSIIQHPNAVFKHIAINASGLAYLSYQRFKNKIFANLAYCEPLYLKEFHTGFANQIQKKS